MQQCYFPVSSQPTFQSAQHQSITAITLHCYYIIMQLKASHTIHACSIKSDQGFVILMTFESFILSFEPFSWYNVFLWLHYFQVTERTHVPKNTCSIKFGQWFTFLSNAAPCFCLSFSPFGCWGLEKPIRVLDFFSLFAKNHGTFSLWWDCLWPAMKWCLNAQMCPQKSAIIPFKNRGDAGGRAGPRIV